MSTDPLALAERVFALLDEGRKSATYKLALLMALLDHCLETTAASGVAPSIVTTRELAVRIVGLYWPHADPYKARGHDARVLKQGTSKSEGGTGTAIIDAIVDFRAVFPADPAQTFARASLTGGAAFDRLLDRVERTLILQPIPKLQRAGGRESRFLYEYGWDDADRAPSEAQLRKYQRDHTGFDNRLILQDGVATGLVRLNTLLRPALQREWLRLVVAFNADVVEEAALDQHLFGHPREALAALAPALAELQHGRCFYCEGRLQHPEVDHFVPRARHANDGLDNLVVADGRCNGRKSDHLASADHVARWSERLTRHAADLRDFAKTREISFDPTRAAGVARALYGLVPDDVLLWKAAAEFEAIGPGRGRIIEALAKVA